MKLILASITSISMILGCLIGVAQTKIPIVKLSVGSGPFHADTYDYEGTSCEIKSTFKPGFLFAAHCQFGNHISIGLKANSYETVHSTGSMIHYGNGEFTSFCYREYNKVYAVGPEFRFIMFSSHRLTIQPGFFVQKAKQFLQRTLFQVNNGLFEPSNQRFDHVNKTFWIAGTGLSIAYQVTPNFGVSVTGNVQNGGSEFGAYYGGTVDVSWSFYRKKEG